MEDLVQIIKEGLSSNTIIVSPNEGITLFIFFVQWSALILSASASLYSARRNGMDSYGAMVIAFIVAVGGGTMRDILLGRYPIFWIEEPIYAFTVCMLFLIVVILELDKVSKNKKATKVIQPVRNLAIGHSKTYLLLDSLALGLWAYLGSYYALLAGTALIIAPIMGVITACFGGILRDIFFARVPRLLMPGQLYTTAAAIGASVYVILWWTGTSNTIAFLACLITTFTIRMVSVRFNILSS